MTRIPATTALGALGLVALGAFAMALGVGSVALGPAAVLQALLGDGAYALKRAPTALCACAA